MDDKQTLIQKLETAELEITTMKQKLENALQVIFP